MFDTYCIILSFLLRFCYLYWIGFSLFLKSSYYFVLTYKDLFVFPIPRSFGITLWEIWSHGAMPYDNMSGPEVVEFLANDGRLAKPRKCPAKVSEVIDKWKLTATFYKFAICISPSPKKNWFIIQHPPSFLYRLPLIYMV